MVQNRIQFQPGMSMPEFIAQDGTVEQCARALERVRWPEGFCCPHCGSAADGVSQDSRAKRFQCKACRHQTSLTADTVMEATKLANSSNVMNMLNTFFIKALIRLKIISRFNFHVVRYYRTMALKVPLMKGMGVENYFLTENWLDQLVETFVNPDKGAFVDVGVNIGQSLIRVKSRFPGIEYIGFEPNAACVFYVNTLVEENRFEHSMVYDIALHSQVKRLRFEHGSIADKAASVVTRLRPGVFPNKKFVLGANYDPLFVETPISFVKIDVEGGELDVLVGMRKSIEKHRPIITCEVLDSHSLCAFKFTQERATLVSEFLAELNYSIVNIETLSQRIVGYKIRDTIQLRQWTEESERFNDYMFVHDAVREDIIKKLDDLV